MWPLRSRRLRGRAAAPSRSGRRAAARPRETPHWRTGPLRTQPRRATAVRRHPSPSWFLLGSDAELRLRSGEPPWIDTGFAPVEAEYSLEAGRSEVYEAWGRRPVASRPRRALV